ncbi:MAG: SAF domain-containing protein [Selenomonadaceae bacterium]|nr:SAF domain-containing protein [Selenomonadaceae bacterium]
MFTKIMKALNSLVKRLTPRQLLFGAGALALITILMVYTTLTHIKQSFEEEAKALKVEPIQMTKVVVAKVNIPRGVVIQADMLTVKDFAVKSLPKGTSNEIENFINLPTKLEIFAGDILTTEKVFTDYRQATAST